MRQLRMIRFPIMAHVRAAVTGALVCFLLVVTNGQLLAADRLQITVQYGDTLSQIAVANGVDMATLMSLNNIYEANDIFVGQRLTLPSIGSAVQATASQGAGIAAGNGWFTYEVQSGDTLGGLAWKYQIGLAVLAETNRISWNQKLYVGQLLQLPQAGSVAVASTASAQSTGVVAANQTHIVAYGEHLGTIAARYGTTAQALMRANQLANPSLIIPGQTLQIPAAGSQPVAIPATSNQTSVDQFPTTTEKWIEVDLSAQTVTAYNGTQAVATFLVSTGLPWTPTVQGTFRIWATTPIQDMSGGNLAAGDSYYLRDVKHVQYFYGDYAFHAAYWHNNFGQPMSRGCVNMRAEDAEWLFNWASPQVSRSAWTFLEKNAGTLVWVHE